MKIKQKKGISLIVLVITIIVMIILASAIILSLNSSGIIGKANEAVEAINLAQVKETANLKWAEAYANNITEKNELETYVLTELEKELKDISAYNIVVTESGVEVYGKIGGVSANLYAPIEEPYKPDSILDISTLESGFALATNGTNILVSAAAHSASQEISVEPGTDYILKIGSGAATTFRTIYILDDNTITYQTINVGANSKRLITIPENCNSFRLSGITEYIEDLTIMKNPTITVAFNGDSITGLPYGWSKNFCKYYYYNELNYAIGGSALANFGGSGTPSKTRDPLVERYTNMDTSADICMIAIGTNDWNYSWVDIGTDADTVTTTFKGALHTLCKGLKEMYNGKQIIFLTPIKRGKDPNAINNFGKTLEDYANAIIDVCAQYDIDVIDLYHNCPLDPSISEQQAQFFDGNLNTNEGYTLLYNDTTHPNVYGARVQARSVIEAYENIRNN